MLQYKAGAGFLPESARPFWVLAKELFFVAGLIAAAFIDLDYRIIPNRLVLGLLAGAVLLVPLAGDVGLTAALLGSAAAGGALLLLAVLFRDGMGGGDIKLAAVAGLYLGWPMSMLGLFIGALLGSFLGILMILAGRRSRKDFIPFGPYLAVGFFIVLLWGEQIVRWYGVSLGVG
jgi:leader peptidase (prepilin peptidase)/N-methyltransferase